MSFHSIASSHDPSRSLSEGKIQVGRGSFEYNDALRHASIAMRREVVKVEKINSPTLYAWFLARKAEYESRGYQNSSRTLLHVTGAVNIDSILSKNLDWRRVTRGRFGNGISFSDDAEYANKYAARSIGANRAMIVADVLVGKTMEGMSLRGGSSVPPEGIDTTVGNNHVYVKFYDDEFYPKYIVYYVNDVEYLKPRRHFSLW